MPRRRTSWLQHLGGRVPFLGRATPRLHARLYRLLGGRGRVARWFGGPVALLEATGRKSGKTRPTPVIYARDGDDLVVVAANAGNPKPPAWWLNLQENPDATIEIAGEKRRVRAREAHGEERDRLLEIYERVYPRLDDYREFADHDFPVVVLEPAAS
ncbi:MAG TPA: nitroreductase/quinone reductase family protein [Thermoleophilaceae bacterium]